MTRLAGTIAVAALVVTAGLVLTAQAAVGGKVRFWTSPEPGINPQAALATDGRQVVVTGHIVCRAGDSVEVQVTVTQRALAEGIWRGSCTGVRQPWSTTARARGQTAFELGRAEVCAIATTFHRGTVSGQIQWCQHVRLVTSEQDSTG